METFYTQNVGYSISARIMFLWIPVKLCALLPNGKQIYRFGNQRVEEISQRWVIWVGFVHRNIATWCDASSFRLLYARNSIHVWSDGLSCSVFESLPFNYVGWLIVQIALTIKAVRLVFESILLWSKHYICHSDYVDWYLSNASPNAGTYRIEHSTGIRYAVALPFNSSIAFLNN